jgi:tetratricopeptide (TPR) repeat protein
LWCLLVGSASAADPDEAAIDAAELHSQKGLEHYNEERYPEAVREMLAAYQAVPDAALLYNIARIYQTMQEPDLAVEYFYRFVKSPDADPDTVQKALAYLAALREQAAALVAAPASVEPVRPVAVARVPSVNWQVVPLIVGASGLATGVVAGLLAASAQATYLDADVDYDERLLAQGRGRKLALWADVGWTFSALGSGMYWAVSPRATQVSIGSRW